MTELPWRKQPPGYVVLYRGERPANCLNVDQATEELVPGGTRGRWFTTSLSYAQAHLAPRRFSGILRGVFDIPDEHGPLKYPERYSGVWRITAVVLPEDVARQYFCRNTFEPADDGRAMYRRVDYPMQRATERAWRKALYGRGPEHKRVVAYLLPADIAARATVLKEGRHLEVWAWAGEYLLRGVKPIPPEVVNVSLEELEATRPEIVERLETIADTVPEAWRIRALVKFPNLGEWAGLLDGEDESEVLHLAEQISGKLAKKPRPVPAGLREDFATRDYSV